MLQLMVGGIMGPMAVTGLTTTTSTPFSSANLQAAFSASVLETGYQTCICSYYYCYYYYYYYYGPSPE